MQTNADGTTTFVLVPTTGGTTTVTLVVETARISARRCPAGKVRIKGRCRPVLTVLGSTSAIAKAGVPLRVAVRPNRTTKALLRKGRTIRATAVITLRPAGGGKPIVTRRKVTLKPRRR